MKIKSSRIAYECPIFRIEERKVLVGKNGNHEETHWVVVRPPNVGIIGLTPEGKVVLTKEMVGKDNKSYIGFPAGKANNSDTLKELKKQALQELESEAGYTTKNIKLLETHEIAWNWFERKYYRFVAWNLKKITKNPEAGEMIKVILKTPNEVKKMMKQKEITNYESHTKEVEALQKAIEYFKKCTNIARKT